LKGAVSRIRLRLLPRDELPLTVKNGCLAGLRKPRKSTLLVFDDNPEELFRYIPISYSVGGLSRLLFILNQEYNPNGDLTDGRPRPNRGRAFESRNNHESIQNHYRFVRRPYHLPGPSANGF
jgi:hypothetical protein